LPCHITSHEKGWGENEDIGAEKSIEVSEVFYIDAEKYLSMMRQFHLGQHKVQQLKGSKTLVLPAHWCKNSGIQAGDAISMILTDGATWC